MQEVLLIQGYNAMKWNENEVLFEHIAECIIHYWLFGGSPWILCMSMSDTTSARLSQYLKGAKNQQPNLAFI